MDLEVQRGEVLGLLGPNGAGETTTVRLLAALIEPTEGTASVDGLDVRLRPDEVRARVCILTETPGLYEMFSATANLDFVGRLYGLDAATRAERIERYLRLFSLSADRRRSIDTRVSSSCGIPAGEASAILRAVGVWRSLVAHLNGVQEVPRSNRGTPTIDPRTKRPREGSRGPSDSGRTLTHTLTGF